MRSMSILPGPIVAQGKEMSKERADAFLDVVPDGAAPTR
jgi:hypothetical protein